MPNTFITGASSGIGRSLARKLALKGDAVAVMARRQPELDALVREIAAAGGRATAIVGDVTDRAAVAAAVRAAEESLGPLDRLIANAGGGKRTPAESFSAADVEEMFRLNVIGVANCIEAVLPGMLARRRGHIVVMGSLAGVAGLPQAAGYCAAKAALRILAESLRAEIAGKGIDVTCLAPGFVRTRAGRKPRPLEMDMERATDIMAAAIMRRVPYRAFPRSLAVPLTLLRLLPDGLRDKALRLLARG